MNENLPETLVEMALALAAAGVSVIPIDHKDKRPLMRVLPEGPDGKATWKPFHGQIADAEVIRQWFIDGGVLSIAIIAGGVSGYLLVIDFDEERLYHAWCELVGNLADGLPVQRTGGGGYQVLLRCPNPGGSQKLAWVPDPTEESGRSIGIETRGEGGYAVVAPSLHPSGNHYQWISGDPLKIPTIPQAQANALLAAARQLDEAPYTRAELECQAAEVHRKQSTASRNGSGSVIDAFNKKVSVHELLERYGYVKGTNGRYKRAGGTSFSVRVHDGRSFHWSTNDALNDGRVRSDVGVHDAFDIYCHLEHAGDVKVAVRAAAECLGLNRPQGATGRLQNPSQTDPSGDETPSGAIENGVLSPLARKRGRIEAAVEAAESEPYVPFPTDVLPEVLARFIREAATSIGCDEAMIALPLLVGLAIAIGTTRRIQLKPDWREFPIIWAAIVASSGQRKTPALYAATQPLHEIEGELFKAYREKDKVYRQQEAEYRQALKHSIRTGDPAPDEPEQPVHKRHLVKEITVEALALILEENPRGVGLVRDELSALLVGFNQYRGGKGADASQWLEFFQGGPTTIDRKTGDRRKIHVPRAACSMCGTIQPGVIQNSYGKLGFESGFVARTLFAMPPSQAHGWNETSVTALVADQLRQVYKNLLSLEFDPSGNPIDLPLTAPAKNLFVQFVNEHGQEQATLADERLEAAWSKLEGYAARLALVLHLSRAAANDPSVADSTTVDAASMRSAIALVRWFGREAERVYGQIGVGGEDRDRVRLIQLIKKRGGQITVRELAQASRKYRKKGNASLRALEALVALQVGRWQQPKDNGAKNGRPKQTFILFDSSPAFGEADQCDEQLEAPSALLPAVETPPMSISADRATRANGYETPLGTSPEGVSLARGSETEGFVTATDVDGEQIADDLDAQIDRLEREGIQEDGAVGGPDG